MKKTHDKTGYFREKCKMHKLCPEAYKPTLNNQPDITNVNLNTVGDWRVQEHASNHYRDLRLS